MNVGVLGRGVVGQRLAAAFAQRGHQVVIGTRDPANDELQSWLAGDGAGVTAGSLAQTAEFGELIVLAVLGNAAEEAIAQAGPERFAGKVVIDATNPLDFSEGTPPRLSISGHDSLGEHIQRAIPDAKVVKALNTIGNQYFTDPSFAEGQATMFIAGDDKVAKTTVAELLESFGWPPAVDVGGIDAARELESLCVLWVRLGFIRGGWDHGFKLLTG
jgi:8-hydroxy-5-deazaflavin:NADPH oxidoreductase